MFVLTVVYCRNALGITHRHDSPRKIRAEMATDSRDMHTFPDVQLEKPLNVYRYSIPRICTLLLCATHTWISGNPETACYYNVYSILYNILYCPLQVPMAQGAGGTTTFTHACFPAWGGRSSRASWSERRRRVQEREATRGLGDTPDPYRPRET